MRHGWTEVHSDCSERQHFVRPFWLAPLWPVPLFGLDRLCGLQVIPVSEIIKQ